MTPLAVRRCRADEWRDVRHLHVELVLSVPLAVHVELGDEFATPERSWQDFTSACASALNQALFVGQTNGALAGMGHVRLDERLALVDRLFVHEPARRRGLGTAILDALEGWAHEAGAREFVGLIPNTSAAVQLVARSGWQRTEEVVSARNNLLERRWIRTPSAM